MIQGLLGLYSTSAFWIIVLVPAALTVPWVVKALRSFPRTIGKFLEEFSQPGDRSILTGLGLLFLFDLINCANAAVGWDAAVHHYAFPEALLRAGALVNVPEITFSFYPSLGEMLFTLGLGLDGEFLAGAFSWVFLIPMTLALLSIGKSIGQRRIGLWASVIFLGAPLTLETPYSGLIDLPYFTFCLLSLAVLLETIKTPKLKSIFLAGILIGFACATKHLGLMFLAGLLPIVIYLGLKSGNRRLNPVMFPLVLIFLSLLVPLPWYIRSWVGTGNPIHPFFSSLFNQGANQAGSFSLEAFARTDYPRNLPGFMAYLWHLTMTYWDLRPWYWAITPAWLALLPGAIVLAIKPPAPSEDKIHHGNMRVILILAFLTMLINFFMAPAYPRYMYPTWLCLSLLGGYVLLRVREYWPQAGKVLLVITLTFPFVIVLGMSAKRTLEVTPQLFNDEARHRAIAEAVPGYDVFEYINESLQPPGNYTVLSIDPKIYYMDVPAIIAKPGIESDLLIPWDSSPGEIISNWQELGITHLLLDTTLLSVKHGFGITYFSSILGDRDAVWLDITTTHAGAIEFGIDGILSDEEFLYMSELGRLPVIIDGTYKGSHLFTRESREYFQSLGRDYLMAEMILKFREAGILQEVTRSEIITESGTMVRSILYSVHPELYNGNLPELTDVSGFCRDYEDGPYEDLPREYRID